MPCARHDRPSDLIVLVADSTGTTQRVRLCCARWWQVLGAYAAAAPSPYRVWLDYGGLRVQVDNVAGGLHGTAFVAAGDDIFIQLDGMTVGARAFLGVGR